MRVSEWPTWPCAIEVDGLVKSYGSVRAADGVTFQVTAGEIFGLLGANGAGKTTVLGMLEGVRRSDEGRVRVLGWDVADHASEVKRYLGVQLQEIGLLPELTAIEQVQLFGRLAGLRVGEGEALDWLERVGLTDQADRRSRHLSRGQQQRLAVAIAFVGDPELILLDEPTAGLDPYGRRAVWEMIHQAHRDGRTVLFSTHELNEAEALCHRVAILDRGRCRAVGSPGGLVGQCRAPAWITTAAPLTAQQVAALPGVTQVQAQDSQLRLATHEVAATIAALVEVAQDQGVSLDDLLVRQPTLEDVFLELTGSPQPHD